LKETAARMRCSVHSVSIEIFGSILDADRLTTRGVVRAATLPRARAV
jgi:hypothetical protein